MFKDILEFTDEYRWLSNFTDVNIELDSIMYQSVEHAYMSAKSDNVTWKKFCANPQNNAGKIKRSSKAIDLVDGWDDLKLSIMRECLNQKFNQQPFMEDLLDTEDVYIQEGNNWGDTFWGVCLKTNEGENLLGKMIMEIREGLHQKQ